jgi:hypothetical protein
MKRNESSAKSYLENSLNKDKILFPNRSLVKTSSNRLASSLNTESCLKDANGNDITAIIKDQQLKTMDNRGHA